MKVQYRIPSLNRHPKPPALSKPFKFEILIEKSDERFKFTFKIL